MPGGRPDPHGAILAHDLERLHAARVLVSPALDNRRLLRPTALKTKWTMVLFGWFQNGEAGGGVTDWSLMVLFIHSHVEQRLWVTIR